MMGFGHCRVMTAHNGFPRVIRAIRIIRVTWVIRVIQVIRVVRGVIRLHGLRVAGDWDIRDSGFTGIQACRKQHITA